MEKKKVAKKKAAPKKKTPTRKERVAAKEKAARRAKLQKLAARLKKRESPTHLSGRKRTASELQTLYRNLAGNKPSDYGHSSSFGKVDLVNHGISEIGIERTACYGPCPVYTFIVKNDESFHYTGEMFVKRKGQFTGKINGWEFDHLAQFIKDMAYMALGNSYSDEVDDLPTVYTTVVMNGERKVVMNHANAGPTKLWAIERLIDGLLAEAKWDGEPDPPEDEN